jgi:EAL domain-containing protein (putative c-di-GMP-specific phosphodiesterase class I)
MNLASDLTGAVTRGEIAAVFQPQIDMRTGVIVAVEALARWNHPQLGSIAPTTFIPIAEEHQLIAEIGDFMLDEGCRCAEVWNASGARIEVAVNVSPAQLLTTDFLDRIRTNLTRRHLSAGSLTIEITESLPVTEEPAVLRLLDELGDLGLGISVDDFGTGYASVERLLSLPATELKLDQSLVQVAGSPPPYVVAAIRVAHENGLRVVAEGIENEEQFVRARDLGCDRAQGYLFSRPASEEEIGRVLAGV